MKNKARMKEIIRRLEKSFSSKPNLWIREPFEVLIATILSQNTSEKNARMAFSRLKEHFDLRPEVLACLKPEDLKPMIKCAGLSEIRSLRIINISKEILKRFNGNVSTVLLLPLNEAREVLMSIKGIGPKTTDVFLSFVGGFPVMPVDTNIFRVIDKIGFVKGRNYERTRKSLERLIPDEKLNDMHFYLIKLGREICKPRKPLCLECPVESLCNYGVEHINNMKRR